MFPIPLFLCAVLLKTVAPDVFDNGVLKLLWVKSGGNKSSIVVTGGQVTGVSFAWIFLRVLFNLVCPIAFDHTTSHRYSWNNQQSCASKVLKSNLLKKKYL